MEVGFQSVEHAEMAAAMNYASATAFYAAMGRGDLQVGPTPRPPPPRRARSEAAASSTDGPGGALGGYLSELQAKAAEDRRMRELQERIAGEIQQDAADRAASGSGSRPPQTQQAQQQAPEQTGPPGGFPAPAPAWARYPNANRMTGEGSSPMLPRKPPRNATRAELAEHERRYRQIVDDRMALCSAEWRHHIRDMHLAGAESTEPIVDPDLQQLAVANMTQLADIERRAGTGEGQMMPVADEAAYFFLRKLPPGVRGMRVPERLTGEVWVIGWCGRPCPHAGARCLSSVERCLRPVVVRRGESANLGDLEHHTSTMSARSAIGRAGAAASSRPWPPRRTSTRTSSTTSLARRVVGPFVGLCLSFFKFPADALASLSVQPFSAEHVGCKHRRVSPRSLHHRTGRKSRRPGVRIISSLTFRRRRCLFFFSFRQARWLEETGFPAHAPPCRRSTFTAATVSPSWLERSSSSALRNTSRHCRRLAPTTWHLPWLPPPPWSRRGCRQRCW